MAKKKIISILLIVGIIGSVSIFTIDNNIQAASQDIKITAYKASTIANENGYQIDKYEDVESEGWISDNEVLTLTKKGEHKDAYNLSDIKYCSIYNLNTKESKDFKDVNIDQLLGISPDKKYVLYAEVRNIPAWESEECKAAIAAGEDINIDDPKWESEEHKAAIASGEFFHRNIKLLNLSTGEITDVATDIRNSDTEFRWVDGNNILINYYTKCVISDLTGKVLEEGNYNNNWLTFTNLTGVEDIKYLDTGLEGKIYYTSCESGVVGSTLYSMDVKTKQIKKISFNHGSTGLGADKKGNTILLDNTKDNGPINSKGVFVNRTFGALILDETGKVLHDVDLATGKYAKDFILSPDGSKVAFIEENNCIKQQEGVDEDPVLKIIDTKTGNIKEIVKGTALDDSNPDNDTETDTMMKPNISNVTDLNNTKIEVIKNKVVEIRISTRQFSPDVKWDSTGTSLSFTYEKNTYIVSFDN
jgi:hypothetical protein